MSDLKPIRVSGTIAFAKDMTVPNTNFNPDETRVACTISQLSDAAVEALKGLGIKPKSKDSMLDLGSYITSKSKFPFEPVTEDGQKVDPAKLGNGSRVVALVSAYDHKMARQHGKGVRISKLIVTDLKEYNPGASIAEDSTEAL